MQEIFFNFNAPLDQTSARLTRLVERSSFASSEVKPKQLFKAGDFRTSRTSNLKKTRSYPRISSIGISPYGFKSISKNTSKNTFKKSNSFIKYRRILGRVFSYHFKDISKLPKSPTKPNYLYTLTNRRNEPIKIISRLPFRGEKLREIILISYDKALLIDHVYRNFTIFEDGKMKLRYPFRCEKMLISEFDSWAAKNTGGHQQIVALGNRYQPKPSSWAKLGNFATKIGTKVGCAAKTVWVDHVRPRCTWKNLGTGLMICTVTYIGYRCLRTEPDLVIAPTLPPETPETETPRIPRIILKTTPDLIVCQDVQALRFRSPGPRGIKYIMFTNGFPVVDPGTNQIVAISHQYEGTVRQRFVKYIRRTAQKIYEMYGEEE
jgi:hypothetical protein